MKKKRGFNIFFTQFLIITILSSCKNHGNTLHSEINCRDIKIDISKGEDIKLSSFADNVKYVKLQTTNESLFSIIEKILVNEFGIFIFNSFDLNKVLHFSLKGEFIGSIGRSGKGQGEYIRATDFYVNTENKTVELDDIWNNTLFIYDFENKFIKEIKHKDYRMDSFTKLKNKNYLIKLSGDRSMKYGDYNIIETNPNGTKTLEKMLPIIRESDIIHRSNFCSNLQDGKVLFTIGLTDTIYEYGQSLIPRYFVNFGNLQVPRNELNKNETSVMSLILDDIYCGYIYNLYQISNMIYFSFTQNASEKYICCFNAANESVKIISNILGLGNEIYDRPPVAIFDDQLIFLLDANKISSKNRGKNDIEAKFGEYDSISDVSNISFLSDNAILTFMTPKTN